MGKTIGNTVPLPRGTKIAKIGDIVYWVNKKIEMEVVMVREHSVIVQHLTYPVVGREEEFEHERTVVHHRNYRIVSPKTKRK